MNIQSIDNQINDILNVTRDLPQFNQPEHAGVCSAGPLLIGALIVCNIARESLSSGSHAAGSEGSSPSNWKIDEAQEKALQQWAEEKGVWIPEAEQWKTCSSKSWAKTMYSVEYTLNTGTHSDLF